MAFRRRANSSDEQPLDPCGSFILNAREYVTVAFQGEGNARVAELVRDGFDRHAGCDSQRSGGVAQVVEPDPPDPGFRQKTVECRAGLRMPGCRAFESFGGATK